MIQTSPQSSSFEQLRHPKYRADIDGLRAIAVLLVVGYHAFPGWVKSGFIGVDVFFVISGFLITSIILENQERQTFTFIGFYLRRINRIFPALIVVLTCSYIVGWYMLLPEQFKQLGKHISGGAGFISNILLWKESGYFDSAAETKPLLHLWSLGIEEQFYLFWPMLLWFAYKQKFNRLYFILITGALSLALNLRLIHIDPVATFYSPLTRFWELLIGSTGAYLYLHKDIFSLKIASQIKKIICDNLQKNLTKQQERWNEIKSIMGCTLLGVGIIFISKKVYFPGAWALLPTIGAVLIISAGPQAWVNRKILSNRILIWFGLISFPLYLWHWVILSFLRIDNNNVPTPGIRITAIGISILLAWITFRFIERPARYGSHQKITAAILAVTMLAVGYTGYNTYKREGLGFRFPKIIQQLTEYKYDYTLAFREGTCFLRPEQNFGAFEACPLNIDPKKPTIFLWGDSHAAHLYEGVKTRYSGSHNIIQRTASGCPPILHMDVNTPEGLVRPFCKDINDRDFALIKKLRPDTIILAANWGLYDWKTIAGTIKELQAANIANLKLIGPVPQWRDNLPRQVYLYIKNDLHHKVPKRISSGLTANFAFIDKEMNLFSKSINIEYISPITIMCNADGCLTQLGETADTLTAFDYGHLTAVGSRYLVSMFPEN